MFVPSCFIIILYSFIYVHTQGLKTIKLEKVYSEETIFQKELNGIQGNYRRTKRSSHKIPLANFKNYQYYGKVKFGSYNQEYKILFDTGSDYTWIPKGHSKENKCSTKYKHYKSTSFQDFNKNKTLEYVKGEVTIRLGSDSVTIGNMTVMNQTLGLAIKNDCGGVDQKYEGIIGMSFHSIYQPSILQNMLSQGFIKEPVFAFHFSSHSSSNELIIGGYNPEYIKNGELNTVNVTDSEAWQVQIEIMTFGNEIIAINQKAIIDSGSSIISAPYKFLQCILDIIKKSNDEIIIEINQENGLLSFTRSSSFKVPNISFIFRNNDYTLTDEDYTIKTNDKIGIGISFNKDVSDTWVLGDSFLRKFHTVFNFANRTISFPKTTRFIDGGLLKSNFCLSLTSMGNSMNTGRSPIIIYTLLPFIYIYLSKFNSIF
ncbi:pepsin B [Halyomorpha halys]|uniref:pepsin B n=1 Tax=Halyomorpha halys TaxID=286706 RepID=UPI0006D512F9|nr:gastricsin-like [Halyomorpha halys]